MIDAVRRPFLVAERRQLGPLERLHRPPLAILLADLELRRRGDLSQLVFLATERSAETHPLGDQVDLFIVEPAGGRHLELLVLEADRMQQQAGVRLADVDRRPAVTAAQQVGAADHQQPALVPVRVAVALEAPALENRLDPGVVEIDTVHRRLRDLSGRRHSHARRDRHDQRGQNPTCRHGAAFYRDG